VELSDIALTQESTHFPASTENGGFVEDTQEQERERVRSPNYPAYGLATAVQRVDALYKRDGKAAISTAAAVKAWGYSSINGRSLSVLGALRQFGLLEDAGPKMVKLSQVALAIQLAPPGSKERDRAFREAGRRPKVFAELFDQYKDGFPSDDAMVSNLVLNSPYNHEAAERLIASFRETRDLLVALRATDTSQAQAPEGDKGDDQRRTPDQKPKEKEKPMPETGRESIDIPIPIISGGLAYLRVPRRMSEVDYINLTGLVTSVLTGMKAALVAPADPPAPKPEP
jgi:hypothetical protein